MNKSIQYNFIAKHLSSCIIVHWLWTVEISGGGPCPRLHESCILTPSDRCGVSSLNFGRALSPDSVFYPPLQKLSKRFNGIISKRSRSPTNPLGRLVVVEICMGSDDARQSSLPALRIQLTRGVIFCCTEVKNVNFRVKQIFFFKCVWIWLYHDKFNYDPRKGKNTFNLHLKNFNKIQISHQNDRLSVQIWLRWQSISL